MSVTKRGPILFVIAALFFVLVAGSGTALVSTRLQNGRNQAELDSLNSSTSDLTSLGAIANISAKGWNAAGIGGAQIISILTSLRERKCCVLESEYAVPTLQSLDHIQLILADEKKRIADTPFSSDESKTLQAAMVKAYSVNEQLVGDVLFLISDWSSTFGEDKREARIKVLEDSTQAGVLAYVDAQTNIDNMIGQTRSQQDAVATRMRELRSDQPRLQTLTYVLIGIVAVSILLCAVWLFLVMRARQNLVPIEAAKMPSKRRTQKQKS